MLLSQSIGEWLVARATGRRFGDRAGQAMTEYVLTAGVLLATVAVMAVFLYTFKEHSGRVLELAASEYP
jgi:hypothetical protein